MGYKFIQLARIFFKKLGKLAGKRTLLSVGLKFRFFLTFSEQMLTTFDILYDSQS